MAYPRLSVVIVAHNSLADLRMMVPALLAELGDEDELVVVDNGSSDELPDELGGLAPTARLVTASGNEGFAAGANLGVAAAQHELIVLLNPDAVVQPGWSRAIRAPWGSRWAGWMALVTMDGGTRVNTSGGVLHFTGLAWAGQVGQPLAAAPQAATEVGFLSGACLALPRATWREVGGLPEQFFMYHEDVDLSLRLRLRGGRLAVIPDAQVIHDYDFAKGARKWRLLERNRWATILRTYPTSLLVLLAPALAVTEMMVWVASVRGGWARMKALAACDVLRSLPRLMRERRAIQSVRSVPVPTFAAAMSAELSSPYLGGAAKSCVVRGSLQLYWSVVRFVLRVPVRRP